jgi:hypothetical protein
MNLRYTLTAIFALLFIGFESASAQATGRSSKPRQVDLNEFTFNGNGLKKMRKKVRVDDTRMIFPIVEAGNPRPWDSSYWLTRFPAPTDKKILLTSVEGRIADFDTSNFDLYLAVIQLNGSDTVFREIPITLAPDEKRPKHWHLMPVRDSAIVLQPGPFFLGYGFHTKPVKESFEYRLYAAHSSKGEGTRMWIKNDTWNIVTGPGLAVFPFKISFLEL